jgi:hypothetical protein
MIRKKAIMKTEWNPELPGKMSRIPGFALSAEQPKRISGNTNNLFQAIQQLTLP